MLGLQIPVSRPSKKVQFFKAIIVILFKMYLSTIRKICMYRLS